MAIKIKRRRVPLDEKHMRQRKIAIVAVFLFAAMFFIGFSIGRSVSSDDSKSKKVAEETILPKAKVRSESTSVGPKNFDLIIPTGFSQSEDGAKKAAATYVESWAQLVFSNDGSVIQAIDYVTNPTADDLRVSLSDSITKARSYISDAVAGQAYHQSVPMKIKVQSYDKKNATIIIWSSEFWAAAGQLEPQANFDFHTLKLVYVNNDWKIDSWVTTPGVSPAWNYRQEPSDSLDFISTLADFEEYKR